jgi:hypothetical protein
MTYSITTRTILELARRPGGLRNDAATRELLTQKSGRLVDTRDLSPRLGRLERRKIIDSKPVGNTRFRVYTLTAKGLAVLTGPPVQSAYRRPRKAAPKSISTRGTWAKAPRTGPVQPQVLPAPTQVLTQGLALGYDKRTQMSPAQARAFVGEFTAEWKRLRGEAA